MEGLQIKKRKKSTGDISQVTEEEENYLRMEMLLTGISPRAVRVLFDKEFHPSCLEASLKKEKRKIFDLEKKRVISRYQFNLLFPRGGSPVSTSFDVTLMVLLLKNLTNLPIYDQQPLSSNTTPTDDVARIKYYRNQLAHSKDGKINTASFTSDWDDIQGAVERLGGPSMKKECKELRSKHLDQSTVPLHIKEEINQILDQWRKNDVYFVQTTAATKVLECVQKNSCITLTARTAVGKTTTLQHIVLKMANEGYSVILVTNPQDILKFYYPKKKTLFVIDDFCGKYSINQADLYKWESVMELIKELLQKKLTKVIVACRLQVYNDDKFKSLSIFRTNVCNLSSEDFKLSQAEKQLIAEKYLKTENPDIIQYSIQVETEMKQLKTNGVLGKYCALALCVMFNNELRKDVLTDEIDIQTRTIIENTVEVCGLNKGTSRFFLLDELNALEHTFIKKEHDVYRTLDDKLFDFLSYYFGKNIIQCLIRNANFKLINERFLIEKEENVDQFITIVPPEYQQMYMQRMIDEWSKGEIIKMFCNNNMNSPTFRQKLLYYLKTLDTSYQRQLAHTCDINNNDTVLMHWCFMRDINFIQWCCDHSVDVNICRYNEGNPLYVSPLTSHAEVVKTLLNNKDGIDKRSYTGASPLFIASQNNYEDGVQLLLEKKADINKCTYDGKSPLYIACQNNHTEIVKLLLKNHASINKCTNDGTSPFLIACLENHVDIVDMLLDAKTDINKCKDTGLSPLYITCRDGHIDILKLLLDKKADINKCTDDCESPLYIACQQNHVDVVKLLLENKASINKCRTDKISPLFIACRKGYTDIVKLLLDNSVHINKCNNDGQSSLFVACYMDNVDIVKLLLNNNVDINKCTDDGTSPLFISCKQNHIEVVKMLLENKADINKCTEDGTSPLFIACKQNQKEVVNMLLENKADVNKCTDDGTSPLFIACEQNQLEVLNTLLENKADVNKCKDTGLSPLYIACLKDYVDIVKLLLKKNADVNKRTDDGISPLFIACQKNHIDIVKLLLDNGADLF